MATDAPTAMRTDPVLTLHQWFSPAYPVGSFNFSHGLDWAVQAGDVSDAAGLQAWIEDVLHHGAGRADALFLAAAYGGDAGEIDTIARAFAPSAERLAETVLQGAAFCRITADVWGADVASLTYPVAVGRAAGLCALPLNLTSTLYLQAFVANLVGAGQRLGVLGQTQAQGMVRDLSSACASIAAQTESGDLDLLSGTAFLSDIASMKHETQYSRMFQT